MASWPARRRARGDDVCAECPDDLAWEGNGACQNRDGLSLWRDAEADGRTVEAAVVPAEAKLVWRTMPGKWCWTPDRMPVRMIVPTDSGKIELVPYGSANLRLSMFPVTVDAR